MLNNNDLDMAELPGVLAARDAFMGAAIGMPPEHILQALALVIRDLVPHPFSPDPANIRADMAAALGRVERATVAMLRASPG